MALTKTPPNLIGQASPEFDKNGFDAAVWQKGYPIMIEKASVCPCQGVDGVAQSDCQNCLGTGYFYINKFNTRAIITGINSDTQYKEWSFERVGTVAVSIIDDGNDNEKVGFYDKITLLPLHKSTAPKPYEHFSENRVLRSNGTNGFVFLTYKPQEIFDVWIFNTSQTELIRVDSSLYSVNATNPYVLDFDSIIDPSNGVISIRYKCYVQYHVLDIPHFTRYSLIKDRDGREQTTTLPIQAIGRKSHLIQNENANYDGSGIKNNSYL